MCLHEHPQSTRNSYNVNSRLSNVITMVQFEYRPPFGDKIGFTYRVEARANIIDRSPKSYPAKKPNKTTAIQAKRS